MRHAKCSALQGARTCYFSSVERTEGKLQEAGHHESTSNMPASSLFALESIIQQRVQQHTQDTGEAAPQHLQQSVCALAIVPKHKHVGDTQSLNIYVLQRCAYTIMASGAAAFAWDVTMFSVCNL